MKEGIVLTRSECDEIIEELVTHLREIGRPEEQVACAIVLLEMFNRRLFGPRITGSKTLGWLMDRFRRVFV